ncbi:hypothetical protein SLS61_003456 [Didymella pomorum]
MVSFILLGQGILQILDNQQEGLFHDSEQLHRLLVVVGGVNSVKKNISESATGFQALYTSNDTIPPPPATRDMAAIIASAMEQIYTNYPPVRPTSVGFAPGHTPYHGTIFVSLASDATGQKMEACICDVSTVWSFFADEDNKLTISVDTYMTAAGFYKFRKDELAPFLSNVTL